MDKQPEIVHHHEINIPQYSFGMTGPEVINTNPGEIKESKETHHIEEETIRRIVREELDKREAERKANQVSTGAHNFGIPKDSDYLKVNKNGYDFSLVPPTKMNHNHGQPETEDLPYDLRPIDYTNPVKIDILDELYLTLNQNRESDQ